MYTSYKLTIEPLSPVSVTQQEVYSKLDYIIDGNYIKIIDKEKLFDKLSEEKLRLLEKKIIGNAYRRIDYKKILTEDLGLKLDEIEYLYKIKQKNLEGYVDIRKFIRQLNQPNRAYIPGSSLKGALNTAYLAYELRRKTSELNGIINKIIQYGKPNLDNKARKKIKQDINEKMQKIIKPFTTEIRLSDSEFIKDDNLVIIRTERYNLSKQSGKKLPLHLEAILPEHGNPNKPISGVRLDIKKDNAIDMETLVKVVNENSRKIIEFELEVNQKGYPLPNGLYAFYKNLYSRIRKTDNNEMILPLGFGTQFHTKTIWVLINEFIEKSGRDYKAKWIINNIINMTSWSNRKIKFNNKKRMGEVIARKVGNNFYRFPTTRLIFKDNSSKVYPLGWVRLTIS